MARSKTLPVVLLAFANDRGNEDRYLRNLPDEHRKLREVLRAAQERKLCEVVDIANATADDIFSVFQSPEYRNRVAVFHFGGHASGYELLLESASGNAAAADAGGLARFLGEQNSLQLVFLNGCSTQRQTQGLLDAGVNGVISTSTAINDGVATQLAKRFYRALAGGGDLRTAFNEASAAAQTEAGGSTRALYAEDDEGDIVADRFPWEMTFREGAESTAGWNLPDAVNNPLFGLPKLPEVDLPQSPYRHLKWFRKEHAELFFGRGREIRDLYRKVTSRGTAPIVLFYGQSGVGKSSLLDAGLIPRLEATQTVRYLRRDQIQGLSGTLDLAFLPEGVDAPPNKAWRIREKVLKKPMTVVLDQIEEVYTRPSGAVSDELEMFLDTVSEIFNDRARRPQGRLILAFRKEWLAEIKRQLNDAQLPYTEVFLERLDRPGVIEAINGPALSRRLKDQYHLGIEQGLAEQIADDLLEDAGGAVAPTLQILLSRMWESAISTNAMKPIFTRNTYSTMRRQGVLLRDFLSQQLSSIERELPQIVSPDLLLDLLSLHTTPLGTATAQGFAELEQKYSHHVDTLPKILEGCKDAYLLTMPNSESREGATEEDGVATRLAHDTLAPLVRERFEASDHPGQRARRILENRAVEWSEGQKGVPLDEQDLSIVEMGRTGMRNWTDDEQRLVDASRTARTQRQRRRRIWKGLGLTGVAAIVVAAGVAGWYAFEADRQREAVVTAQGAIVQANEGLAVALKDMDTSRQVAEDAKKVATSAQVVAEQTLATSLIRPLRGDSEQVTESEFESLWALASNESEYVRGHVFEAALDDPKLCERVARRIDVVAQSAIGLDPARRQQAMDYLTQTLTAIGQRDPAEGDWRQIYLCAAIERQLGPLDADVRKKLTRELLAELRSTRDPRLLAELGWALTRYHDELDPADVIIVTKALRRGDFERVGHRFPSKFGETLQKLTPLIPADQIAAEFDKFAKVRNRHVSHDGRQAYETVLVELADRMTADDASRFVDRLWTVGERSREGADREIVEIPAVWEKLVAKSPAVAIETLGGLLPLLRNNNNPFAYDYGHDLLAVARSAAAALPEGDFRTLINDEVGETWKVTEHKQRFMAASNAPAALHSHALTAAQPPNVATILYEWSWGPRSHTLPTDLSKDRQKKLSEELLEFARIPDADIQQLSAVAEMLVAMKLYDGAIAKEMDGLLLKRLEQAILLDVGNVIPGLAASSVPFTEETSHRIVDRIKTTMTKFPEPLRNINIVSHALMSAGQLDDQMASEILAELVPGTLSLAETVLSNDEGHGELTMSVGLFRFLGTPTLQLSDSESEQVSRLLRQYISRLLLDAETVQRNLANVEQLPAPLPVLNDADEAAVIKAIMDAFLQATSHAVIAALAQKRVELDVPLSEDEQHQLLGKLSLWLYRLPPLGNGSSFGAISSQQSNDANTLLPIKLAEAMSATIKNGAVNSRDREVCAHALMHAMQQIAYQRASEETLRKTIPFVIAGLETTHLLELLKAPWCIADARQMVLQELSKHADIDPEGNAWQVAAHLDPLDLTMDDLRAPIVFPKELRYDVPVLAYLPNNVRPMGGGITVFGQPPQHYGIPLQDVRPPNYHIDYNDDVSPPNADLLTRPMTVPLPDEGDPFTEVPEAPDPMPTPELDDPFAN